MSRRPAWIIFLGPFPPLVRTSTMFPVKSDGLPGQVVFVVDRLVRIARKHSRINMILAQSVRRLWVPR